MTPGLDVVYMYICYSTKVHSKNALKPMKLKAQKSSILKMILFGVFLIYSWF